MQKFLSIVVLIVACCSRVYGDYPSLVLMQALALQESGNNDQALGDKKLVEKAYGVFQIRQPAVSDVNRKLGTHYRAEDCLGNRELSVLICREYINMYATSKRLGHTPTDEDMARIWNGGPNGYKRSSTISYWQSVQKFLSRK